MWRDALALAYRRRHSFRQCTPDRYALNLASYERRQMFFSKDDIAAWMRGNWVNNSTDLARFYFFNLCIDQLIADGIEGDVAELGVYRGNSARLLAKYVRQTGRTLYLCDTFDGFGDASVVADDEAILPGDYSRTSLRRVQDVVGPENVVYVEGHFPDSMRTIRPPEALCLVHLDCDLEASFRAGLDYFYPKLVTGGFLIMHDYASLCCPGAARAVDQFFAGRPEHVIPIPDKSGTAVVRKV
jgi:hypothetical protein